MRAASLFSGVGGLDLAAEALGLEIVVHVEADRYCRDVLARHWPAVPAFDDVRTVDWAAHPHVEALVGGLPCQPVSGAGRRRGTADDRWLWPGFARAVRLVRPRLVLVENVAGLFRLGFGDVVGDLATLGYDTRWTCLRASAVGAPHARARVFLTATPADPDRTRRQGGGSAEPAWGTRSADRAGQAAAAGGGAVALLPTPTVSDGNGAGTRRGGGLDLRTVVHLQAGTVDWREYEPAIRRWETTLGRLAPHPVGTRPQRQTPPRRRLRRVDDGPAPRVDPRLPPGPSQGARKCGCPSPGRRRLRPPAGRRPVSWDYACTVVRIIDDLPTSFLDAAHSAVQHPIPVALSGRRPFMATREGGRRRSGWLSSRFAMAARAVETPVRRRHLHVSSGANGGPVAGAAFHGALSVARQAVPVSLAGPCGVVHVPGVSANTRSRLAEPFGWRFRTGCVSVRTGRDDAQMCGVDAMTHSTKMVDNKTGRDRSHEPLVAPAMRALLIRGIEAAVPERVEVGGPQPTAAVAVRTVYLLPEPGIRVHV